MEKSVFIAQGKERSCNIPADMLIGWGKGGAEFLFLVKVHFAFPFLLLPLFNYFDSEDRSKNRYSWPEEL